MPSSETIFTSESMMRRRLLAIEASMPVRSKVISESVLLNESIKGNVVGAASTRGHVAAPHPRQEVCWRRRLPWHHGAHLSSTFIFIFSLRRSAKDLCSCASSSGVACLCSSLTLWLSMRYALRLLMVQTEIFETLAMLQRGCTDPGGAQRRVKGPATPAIAISQRFVPSLPAEKHSEWPKKLGSTVGAFLRGQGAKSWWREGVPRQKER